MKTVAEVFSDDGALAELIDGYRHRPQQEDMAQKILAAIKQGQSLVCEAGTGTGKTMAYLVPALLSRQKVIVSTGTRHLQDQLYEKDLPIVLQALASPATTMVLKGRSNYLCLQRMDVALHDSKDLSYQNMSDLQEVVQWSSSTKTGDINELGMIEENSFIRPIITSTTENCLGQGCPEFESCFVFKNRKKALESDLVITNHHLLLADMGLRESGFGEVLPLADLILFDEAHQLPELASTYFSKTMSSRQLLELVTDTQTAAHEEAKDSQGLTESLTKFEKSIRDLRLVFGRKDQRLNWQETWDKTDLSIELPTLMKAYQNVMDILELSSERGKLLDNCWQRAKEHYNYIESYMESKNEDSIRWLEIRGHHLYFNQTPVNIAETFQQRLNDYDATSVFTSASLAINNDFKHFSRQLGLEECLTEVWNSPFDYQNQTRLYLPVDLPEPNHPGFFDAFIERTVKILSFSDGHAFVLFTSHQALNKAANILSEKIDYPIFIQGRAPRSELLNQFRKTKHAVLLGTSSFWEGVDVKGEALSSVIIDKLPFASPDDPVLQARLNYLTRQGSNAFMEYQVPQAAIALKQGVGRLIRDVTDKGICTICDKRIVNKAYGKRLINALPSMPITHDIEDIERFFH
ncbi:MAG: ATP-dependent DNA helicase [Proteobacteria bacterium]|nr:ATP-dependent DNA helicase [Pseudomonadota bacterium]NOG59469.1 ATP-dependent DNA helicase [Pseudomonadota bacterium]